MTSPSPCRLLTLGAAAGVALAGILGGCESETTQVQTVAAPPPPRPVATGPKVTPIAQLMIQLGIDDRVVLAEEKAPKTDAQRRAVLEFFDAFARGDAASVRSMLSRLDQLELEELIESGAWAATTAMITRIEVATAEHQSQPVAFAMFHIGYDYQPQLWYYAADAEAVTFDAVATPPDILDRLSGSDWITAWFDLLAEELAKADEPDEEFTVPQKNYSTGSGGSGAPGVRRGPNSPFDPGPGRPGGPGKRPKRGPPRKPPGPPS